jgi:peptide/nickel transport system substrate-binding protein
VKISTKKYAAMAIGLMLLPGLAACGGDTSTATPIAPTATTAAVATATTAAAPTATKATSAATATTGTSAATATSGTAASQTGTATDTKYAAVDCSYGGTMKSIEAVDDSTVKFTLCAADPAFPAQIAFASLGIQSAKHLQETGGGTPALLEHPIGTGAYVVKEWVRGDHLTLEANPNYWGDAPKTKTIIF